MDCCTQRKRYQRGLVMEWTRIQTSLLTSRIPEREFTAVIKFQLLWAELEHEPTCEIALRWITKKQYEIALQYRDSIARMVQPDIKAIATKRGRDRGRYYKSKNLDEIPSDGTPSETMNASASATPEQIIKENNIKNNKTEKQNTGFKFIPMEPKI